jgi:hypothetical protein
LGAEANPSDIRKGKRKLVEELAKDLDPATREAVTRVYENWKGEESEEELKRILGKRLGRKPVRDANS